MGATALGLGLKLTSAKLWTGCCFIKSVKGKHSIGKV